MKARRRSTSPARGDEGRGPSGCVIGIAVTLWLGLPVVAPTQETPAGAGTPAEAGGSEAGAKREDDPPAGSGQGEAPERDFTPSERISEDYSVDFPVDI